MRPSPACALLAVLLAATVPAAALVAPAPAPAVEPWAQGQARAEALLALTGAGSLGGAILGTAGLQGLQLQVRPTPAPADLAEAVALLAAAHAAAEADLRAGGDAPTAALRVARAVDALLPFAARLHAEGPGPCSALDHRPLLCIAGPGADVHTEDAFVLLDQGGDDRYLGAAGGARAGDVRAVVDLGGSDAYEAVLAEDGAAQGAALGAGAGLLWDQGSGADTYRCAGAAAAEAACQGAATRAGFGLLRDDGGDDTYTATFSAPVTATGTHLRTPNSTFAAQGAAANPTNAVDAGLGVLLDGGGDDAFRAEGATGLDVLPPFETAAVGNLAFAAQGAGVGGGVGALADRDGRDHRLAFGRGHKTACAAQGAGLVQGSGVLADGAGDDNYEAHCGEWFAVAPAAGVAALALGGDLNLAMQGAAQYSVVTGVRTSHLHGLLVDLGGSDTYLAHAAQILRANSTVRADARTQIDWVTAQGAGLEGDGQLLDLAGDDTYTLRVENLALAISPQGRAGAAARDVYVYGQGAAGYATGVLADLGGSDTYDAVAVLDARIVGAPITPPPTGITLGRLEVGVQGAGDQRVQSPDQQGLGLLVDRDGGAADAVHSSPYDPPCQPLVIPKETWLTPRPVMDALHGLPKVPVGGARGSGLWFDCDPGGVGLFQ